MLLTALAIDPGPDRSGVVSVSFDGRRFKLWYGRHLRFGGGVFVASSHQPLVGLSEISFLLDDLVAAGGMLVLEHTTGYAYDQFRVPYLLETRAMQERVETLAIVRGIEPVLIPAAEVRGELCRSETVGDGPVRAMVDGLVDGIAHLPAEDGVHVRDACAAAVVALCRAAGVEVPRTPELETALFEALRREQAERAKKRAAKKADEASGLKPKREKRYPTREKRARRSAGAKKGWKARSEA